MKKIIFTLTIFFFFGVGLVYAAGPKIYVEEDTIDLGQVKEGGLYEGSFRVENQGDAELLIKTPQTSCGCLKIKEDKEIKLGPGQKKEIKFSFNSAGYNGLVTQFIYLSTNDPENKIARIEVKADVLREAQTILERFQSFSPGVIIGAGLIDGINPCAFSVLVFFISFLSFVGYSKKQMLISGSSFIFAVFLTYLLLGLGLFGFLHKLEVFRQLSKIVYLTTGLLAIVLGFFSWYDWRIYRRTKNTENITLKLPNLIKKKIQGIIRQKQDDRQTGQNLRSSALKLIITAFSCGIIVSLLESVCTGQLYLPTIVYVLKTQGLHLAALIYLVVYNLMFILPLIIIFALGLAGVSSQKFASFTHKHLGLIKLLTAFVFFSLGIALLLIS